MTASFIRMPLYWAICVLIYVFKFSVITHDFLLLFLFIYYYFLRLMIIIWCRHFSPPPFMFLSSYRLPSQFHASHFTLFTSFSHNAASDISLLLFGIMRCQRYCLGWGFRCDGISLPRRNASPYWPLHFAAFACRASRFMNKDILHFASSHVRAHLFYAAHSALFIKAFKWLLVDDALWY